MTITNLIRFNNLRGDIFGGVTAAVVPLPLALTLQRCLWGRSPQWTGAVCGGFFAALFGVPQR